MANETANVAANTTADAAADAAAAVIKSPADDREYAPLTLDNGLQVMLVSDPRADEAAAAMDVYVGSGDDPDDREGLAHYLEHMLFLGTEKYPEAGEYQKFIRQHGGQNNAYTSLTNTHYYFSIDPAYLAPALDRFAQFFIAPLFNQQYVQRERSVVDSEYNARRKDEGRRLWSARTQAYNPAHPISGFSVGNLASLADRENAPVRDDLVAFYQQHYHSGKMRLVVVAKEPIAQLRAWVQQAFAKLPPAELPPAELPHVNERKSFTVPLFLPNSLPKKITLKPLKETRQLSFSFPIASAEPYIERKPVNYLANLIGHEGEGSLLSELKRRAWASGLSAGRSYMDEVQGVFAVSIALSPTGFEHLDEIGQMLFGYLKLLAQQGVRESYFQEQKRLAELDFKFMEQGAPRQLAQSLAARLQHFAPAEVLIAPYTYQQFDAALIQRFLGAMRPDNLLLSVVDPALQSATISPWYEVEFTLADIEKPLLQSWENAAPQEWMQLPTANPFIAENTQLLAADLAQAKPILLSPINSPSAGKATVKSAGKAADELLVNAVVNSVVNSEANAVANTAADGLQVWHQTLLKYAQPKAEFYFSVQSPYANSDPRAAILTRLYVNAVNDALNSFTYPAYLAGLTYNMYPHTRGFSVRISGYGDKQAILLQRILEALSLADLREIKFSQLQQALQQSLENAAKARPTAVLMSGMQEVIFSPDWSNEEQLAALAKLDIKALRRHAKQLFKEIQVSALSMGNVDVAQTRRLADSLLQQFAPHLSKKAVPRTVIRTIASGQSIIREKTLPHSDSALVWYFQGGDKRIKTQMTTQLLSAVMGPDFYQNLRTENEVGYLVHAFTSNLLEVPGIAIAIQSDKYSVGEVWDLVDDFLAAYLSKLQALTKKQLAETKAGLISQISQQDKTLSQAAGRAWREIDRKNSAFNRREDLIAAVGALTQQDLIDFFTEKILSKRRSDLLLVHYGDKNAELAKHKTAKAIMGDSLPQLREKLNTSFPPY